MSLPGTSLCNRTMAKYLIMYLCISITVIALLLPIYFIAYGNAEHIIYQEQVQSVSKEFWKLQSSLEQCQTYAYNLSRNTDIVKLSLSDDKDSNLALYLYNLTLFQNNNIWESELVWEVITQFANNDTLLTLHSVYQNKKEYYDKFFKYDGLSYVDWQRGLFQKKEAEWNNTIVMANDRESAQAVTFNYYYPSVSNPLTVVSIIVPTERLLSVLMTDEIRQYGNLRLSFGTGEKMLNIEHNSGHSSDTALISLSSFQPRLVLEAGLTHDAYDKATYPIRRTMLIYIFSAFSAALLLSILFARLNIRPLESIIDFFPKLGIRTGEYRGNAYAYIRLALAGVIHSEEQLKEAYELTHTSFEQTVFNMAVKGLCVDPDHLANALGHVSALKGSYVLVGVSCEPITNNRPHSYNTDIAKVTARRLFIERTTEPYLYESDILYVVLNVEMHGGEEAIYSLLNDINKSLSEILKAGLYFGVSQQMTKLDQLSDASNQMVWALETAQSGLFSPVMRYDVTTSSSSSPLLINEELLARLLVQETDTALKAYFENLRRTICVEYGFSPLNAKTIYYSALAVFQKILVELSQDNKPALDDTIALNEYDASSGVRSNIQYLIDTGLQIQTAVCAHRCAQKNKLTHLVLDYIQTHFSSPDLCLTMVADYFALSERYLSALIREQTGKSYSNYVEDIRMSEAQRLLVQTSTTVNDVAECVGYDKANSFYKSFRRYTGISPKQYRMDIQGN